VSGRGYRLTPQPSGARFVHSHVMSMSDLNRGTYTGQFGFIYIERKNNPGRYDQEVLLATHEWEPFFRAAEEMEDEDVTPAEKARKEEQDKNSPPTDGRSDISASPSMARPWVMASPCV
jgi:hypothetical protein